MRADPARRTLAGRVLRFATGSVVATGCSVVAFVVLYGPLGAPPPAATVGAWLAGAVPNYWLNRSWTWRRRGRPDVLREVVPYAAVVLGTLLLATATTTAADRLLGGAAVSAEVRVLLVGATFLGVYVLVFALRFLLLDRLFSGSAGLAAAEDRR